MGEPVGGSDSRLQDSDAPARLVLRRAFERPKARQKRLEEWDRWLREHRGAPAADYPEGSPQLGAVTTAERARSDQQAEPPVSSADIDASAEPEPGTRRRASAPPQPTRDTQDASASDRAFHTDSPAAATGPAAAAAYLRELLVMPGGYRSRWEAHARSTKPGQANHSAIAEVLAENLRTKPQGSERVDVQGRQLRDTVSRALSGRLLSQSALALFIDAFDFNGTDRDRLWTLRNGPHELSVLPQRSSPQSGTTLDSTALFGSPRHRTVFLRDDVRIGRDRLPVSVHTLQAIEAFDGDVETIPFIYDSATLFLEPGYGCKGISGELDEIAPGIFTTEIILTQALPPGETAMLEYWVTYHYLADPADQRQLEYRRAPLASGAHIGIRVEFHPEELPSHIWWSRWDGVDGPIISEEEVRPDDQHSVHRDLPTVNQQVVGFHWTW
jgi:hypothetical protein